MTEPSHRPRYGRWLRDQRQARGWDVREMARQLRDAATELGDPMPDLKCLTVNIHRWEGDRSGIRERYRLLYCRAFGIPPAAFGKPADNSPVPPYSPEALMLAEAEEALTMIASIASELAARIRKLR